MNPSPARDDAPEDSSAAQRRRSAALVTVLLAFAGAGATVDGVGRGTPPASCNSPALRDGLLVCDGNGLPAGARAWLVGARLDLNGASREELEQVPGVGPSLARSILDERTARGRFASFEELDDVQGIGPKTLEKLRPFIEVR